MRKNTFAANRSARLVIDHKRYALLAFLLITLTVSAVAIVSNKHMASAAARNSQTGSSASSPSRPTRRQYISRSRLSPELREAINFLGDRLEKPGKERVTLVGTLSRSGSAEAVPIRLTTEFPHRIRLEVQHGNDTHVIGFDGRSGWKHGATFSREDEDLIESLVYDSADHLFIGQIEGLPTRPLGKRFRD